MSPHILQDKASPEVSEEGQISTLTPDSPKIARKRNRRIDAVIKRDGRAESFDPDKIHKAVFRCLAEGLLWEEHKSSSIAGDISMRVVRLLSGQPGNPTVEEVQDAVEKQLMAAGHYEAARSYILHRQKQDEVRAQEKTIDPEQVALFRRSQAYFEHPIQAFQFYSKYARFRPEAGRRETWEECVDRVIEFFQSEIGYENLAREEWMALSDSILNFRSLPAMRVMQMAGPSLKRCNVGAYNCSYLPIDSVSSFSELLYILMQGTGVGFSVENDYIDKLPRVRKQKPNHISDVFVIPDTTEGWCDALKVGIEAWFSGTDVIFDFSLIRPSGTILRTKGGQASGPEPLMGLLEFTKNRILSRQGSRLSSLDCHDIACKTGEIVQVGGVRRSAEISLSDLDDEEMRHAKQGQFWLQHRERGMANNSAVYNEKPGAIEFMQEWLALAQSGSGERGIFNRGGILKQIPKRRRKANFGVNPCGEIVLRPHQFCNLSIAVARAGDTREILWEKVRLAAIFGTMQSTLTKFQYLRDDWRKNCEEERLLGVDITGQMDCEILRIGAPGREQLLEELRDLAIATNVEYAARFGVPASAAVTCVKPSGNSAQLFNCSSGLHARHAPYYLRRVRIGTHNPLAQLLKDEGMKYWPEVGYSEDDTPVLVFEFPMASPEGAITRHDLDAKDQLENWMVWKKHFTEHNPSITVSVADNEWLEVANWVYENWEMVGGISFLPMDGGLYTLAPYQDITKEQYEDYMKAMPEIDYSKLLKYETVDMTESAQEFACVGGACEI